MPQACVEWPKARTRAGYGVTAVGRSTKYVHRLTMEKSIGRPLETSEVVLHTCDNPACYNIEHLRLGTQADNVQDMIAKGRRGECGRRLSNSDVSEIRRLYNEGTRCGELATQFKVHQSTISRITSGTRRVGQGV